MTATMAVSVAPGEQNVMPRRSLDELQATVWRLSRQILEMTSTAGSGHPSGRAGLAATRPFYSEQRSCCAGALCRVSRSRLFPG